MQIAIRDLKYIIKHYKRQRDESLKLFASDDYKSQLLEPKEDHAKFAIDNTNKIYDDCVAEIQKAIDILERVGDSRRKKHMRKRRCR